MATTVYPKTALATYRHVNRASCFVLMPFAGNFDHIYHRIQETLQTPGLDISVSRADDFFEANILEVILRSIAQSEFIIADLTGLNPNVFYETGIAHCTKEADKVIIITQSLKDVPFDLRHLRCIVYQDSPIGMKSLKSDLTSTFEHLSKDIFRFRMHLGSRFTFDKRLAGRDRNFFELSFECMGLAHDAAKISVSFEEFSVGEVDTPARDQFMVLMSESPVCPLDYLPWDLHAVRFAANEVYLQLERRK